MKGFLALLICLGVCSPLYALEKLQPGTKTSPSSTNEGGAHWVMSGTELGTTNQILSPLPNDFAPNIGVDKGFGADLWIIEDTAFFTNWNKPSEGIEFAPVNRAKRNKPVFTIITFGGPGVNEKKLCNVSYYLLVTTPDGKKYGETLDGDCWKNLPPPAPGQIQLSRQSMKINIEDTDPSGRYIVKAIVYDRVKDAKVELTQYFDVD